MPKPFKTAVPGRPCNVCLQVKPLTKDHVPPSTAVGGRKPMTVWRPFDAEHVDRHPHEPISYSSRTGVVFQTVCEDCHRKLSEYDKSLGLFCAEARRLEPMLLGLRRISDTVRLHGKSEHIVRSVLAHMLTSRFETDQSRIESLVRDITLNGNATAGRDLFLYVWSYSGPLAVSMMYDFVAPVPHVNELRIGWILKFSPLAFFLTDRGIDRFVGLNIEEGLIRGCATVPTLIEPVMPPLWPESTEAAPWKIFGARGMEHVAAIEKTS